MDEFTKLAIAFGIGVLITLIYSQCRVWLIADRYAEEIEELRKRLNYYKNRGIR